jgi:sugar lactone lactonase YvrE
MDECGNLYVTSTGGMVHRILTDGTVEDFVTLPASANTTSVHFGSGLGGWEDDHIYVMNRRGGVFEVPVGIRGRPDAHLPPLSP